MHTYWKIYKVLVYFVAGLDGKQSTAGSQQRQRESQGHRLTKLIKITSRDTRYCFGLIGRYAIC